MIGIAIGRVWSLVESARARGFATTGLRKAGAPGTAVPHGALPIGRWIAWAAITGWSDEITVRGDGLQQSSAWTARPPMGVVLQAIVFGIGHASFGMSHGVRLAVSAALRGICAIRLRNPRPLRVIAAKLI
jgi:hypothetical protein